jgi:hypothetical protein
MMTAALNRRHWACVVIASGSGARRSSCILLISLFAAVGIVDIEISINMTLAYQRKQATGNLLGQRQRQANSAASHVHLDPAPRPAIINEPSSPYYPVASFHGVAITRPQPQ